MPSSCFGAFPLQLLSFHAWGEWFRARQSSAPRATQPSSCAGPSRTGLRPRIPAAQVGRGWDRRVARVRDGGLGGTSQVYLDSKHKALKYAQIERQTFCHKNAASVACGCFNAHTVLVLHADPFDSKRFNRQRTYGKNHTKSDDRYRLIWAGKPSRKGQGAFHSMGLLGSAWVGEGTSGAEQSPGVSKLCPGHSEKFSALRPVHPQQTNGALASQGLQVAPLGILLLLYRGCTWTLEHLGSDEKLQKSQWGRWSCRN